MKKNVIVSLADSNYFELLNELVDSIKSFEKSKDTAICILDAGLSEEQREILSKKVDEIKSKAIVSIKNDIRPPCLPHSMIQESKYIWI